jgi:predicted nucleic acid-binding protein
MAAIIRLQDSTLLVGRNIFVDAMVLIYLFWPTGQYHYEKNYARVFGSLLRQGNDFFVDFLVISEIVNRAIRISMRNSITENEIEEIALSYLQGLGYTYQLGTEISPDGEHPERQYNEVVLITRLRDAIDKLNPALRKMPKKMH